MEVTPDKSRDLEPLILNHNMHIGRLEQIMRLLENDQVPSDSPQLAVRLICTIYIQSKFVATTNNGSQSLSSPSHGAPSLHDNDFFSECRLHDSLCREQMGHSREHQT